VDKAPLAFLSFDTTEAVTLETCVEVAMPLPLPALRHFLLANANANAASINNPATINRSTDPLCPSGSHPVMNSIQLGKAAVSTTEGMAIEAESIASRVRCRRIFLNWTSKGCDPFLVWLLLFAILIIIDTAAWVTLPARLWVFLLAATFAAIVAILSGPGPYRVGFHVDKLDGRRRVITFDHQLANTTALLERVILDDDRKTRAGR